MSLTGCVVGVLAYLGFALFVARMLSWKWHPDGGRTETLEDRDEWFR